MAAEIQEHRGQNAAPRRLNTRRKVAFAAITLVLFFSSVELVARLLCPSDAQSLHQFHESLITTLGLPALNQTMEFDPRLFWRLRENLQNVRITGTIHDAQLDFTVSTHGRYRNSKPVGPKERRRVLILGDSCAFGLGVNDDQTWPAELQRRCDDAKLDVEVINAGVPGYTAFQGRRFLESEIQTIRPDVVIACFGFNDADSWSSRSDLETARQLDRLSWDAALMPSRAYSRLKQGVAQLRAKSAAVAGPERARLEPDEFAGELDQIRKLAAGQHARTILIVWPHANQVRMKSYVYEDYQPIIATYAQRSRTPYVDLVPRFIAQQDPLFVDHVHANPTGCRIAADAVFELLAPLIRG